MKVIRQSRLNQIISATEKQMTRAVLAGAEEAETVMKQLVPVDKGDLASTIETDDKAGGAVVKVGGKSKISNKFVNYEKDVEYGTTHIRKNGSNYSIPAQPFFRPGVEAGKKKMRSEMKIVDK